MPKAPQQQPKSDSNTEVSTEAPKDTTAQVAEVAAPKPRKPAKRIDYKDTPAPDAIKVEEPAKPKLVTQMGDKKRIDY